MNWIKTFFCYQYYILERLNESLLQIPLNFSCPEDAMKECLNRINLQEYYKKVIIGEKTLEVKDL